MRLQDFGMKRKKNVITVLMELFTMLSIKNAIHAQAVFLLKEMENVRPALKEHIITFQVNSVFNVDKEHSMTQHFKNVF